jgi:hypothetical protein
MAVPRIKIRQNQQDSWWALLNEAEGAHSLLIDDKKSDKQDSMCCIYLNLLCLLSRSEGLVGVC